jgi:hypothetical protein
MNEAQKTIRFLFFEAPSSLEPICGSRPYFRQIPPPAPVLTLGRAGRIIAVACQVFRLGWPFVSTAAPEAKAMDVIVLAIGVGFFALMFGYIRVCEKL